MLHNKPVENASLSRSKVCIERCETYNQSDVDTACTNLLNQFRLFTTIPSDKIILIKPNLLSPTKTPDFPVNTHPHVVRSLVKFLREKTAATILIGESSSSFNPQGTSEAFNNSGLLEIAKEYDVQLINFDRVPVVKKECKQGVICKFLEIAEILDCADIVISVPKLKTHELCLMTGAVKNMMGALPGKRKKDAHSHAIDYEQFAYFLVDLYQVAKPHFALMDAVVSMEGNGPGSGDPVHTGVLAASTDGVALDATICRMVGIPAEKVSYLKHAQTRQLGVYDKERIDIAGTAVSLLSRKIVIPDRFYTSLIFALLPRSITAFVLKQIIYQKPEIVQERCIRCMQCFHACPVSCISFTKDRRVIIDKKACQECYCCHEVCPQDAIILTKPLLGRILYRLSQLLK